MITGIRTVSVMDFERALEFFVGKLGLEVPARCSDQRDHAVGRGRTADVVGEHLDRARRCGCGHAR